ncbi:hypothetical protein JAAARDRAFT_333380 [Jaapia argillacea MUCL 33604]|uniref:Uncharacterized protein n=1 Tax=Jaapia argillacea MUCL 33604 TaxID=933084 RepID=A0A067PYA0_9AGAM|nr:hypothetical protein JAAARDRAFT_333380 [Jaapia argillacea MUCL 33604]
MASCCGRLCARVGTWNVEDGGVLALEGIREFVEQPPEPRGGLRALCKLVATSWWLTSEVHLKHNHRGRKRPLCNRIYATSTDRYHIYFYGLHAPIHDEEPISHRRFATQIPHLHNAREPPRGSGGCSTNSLIGWFVIPSYALSYVAGEDGFQVNGYR